MELESNVWKREANGCTDPELVAQLHRLSGADRKLVARLLVYLGEVDARGSYREHAFPSMFQFSVEELKMSEAEAYLRLHAARLARKYPVILPLLATGEVNLTSLRQVSKYLTPDNHQQLLERVRGKSKREVERLVAELEPKPDAPTRMRRLPQRALQCMAAARVGRAPLTHELPSPPASTPSLTSAVTAASASSPPSAATAASNPSPTSAATAASASTERRAAVGVFATATTVATAQEADLVLSVYSDDTAAVAMPAATETSFGRLVNDGATSSPSSSSTQVAAARASDATASAFALEAPREKRATCLPLAPGRYRLQLTATEALHDKLEQLQHLLRHQLPNGDLAVIVGRAVDLLLRKTLKERFAQTSSRTVRPDAQLAAAGQEGLPNSSLADQRLSSAQPTGACDPPAPQPGATGSHQSREPRDRAKASQPVAPARREAANAGNSRCIPRAVRREVFARDGGQCTFIADDGKRCSEHGLLELHHVVAFARGGCSTVENIKLMCRPHNALLAERDFGPELIRQKRQAAALNRRE